MNMIEFQTILQCNRMNFIHTLALRQYSLQNSIMNKYVLIVDDDRTERRLIKNILRNISELQSTDAENGKDALRILSQGHHEICLIILDLDMPIMNGFETLSHVNKLYPLIPVIILTGDHNTDNVVKAMKAGAADFLSKPVENARLEVSVRNTLKMSVMHREISRLTRKSKDTLIFSDLIGFDLGLKESVDHARKAAASDLPILITGETGTGKELFSRAIHGESRRAGKPFVAVNCGAIPENLVESTLFGHEKGSFTGANQKSLGKFQEADGGTLFLDEVGELPLDAQVKLLRVLQQKEVDPVGAAKPVKVDVRLISATHRNLAKDVKDGKFREDLFFRLNVLHIDLPCLSERKSDIPAMAEHFIEQFSTLHNIAPKDIHQTGMEKLLGYSWPGNVRELENVMNRAMAMSDHSKLYEKDFSFLSLNEGEQHSSIKNAIFTLNNDGTFKSYQTLENEICTLALDHHGGNITKTAKILGIAKSTLYSKLNTKPSKDGHTNTQ